jgi:hypothetical protein
VTDTPTAEQRAAPSEDAIEAATQVRNYVLQCPKHHGGDPIACDDCEYIETSHMLQAAYAIDLRAALSTVEAERDRLREVVNAMQHQWAAEKAPSVRVAGLFDAVRDYGVSHWRLGVDGVRHAPPSGPWDREGMDAWRRVDEALNKLLEDK